MASKKKGVGDVVTSLGRDLKRLSKVWQGRGAAGGQEHDAPAALRSSHSTGSSSTGSSSARSGSQDDVALALVGRCVEAQRIRRAELHKDLGELSRSFLKLSPENRSTIIRELRQVVPWEELSEFLVSKSGLNIVKASFRGAVTARALLRRQEKSYTPEWLLDDKMDCLRFVDRMQLRRPALLASGVAAAALPRTPGVVIKPTKGAASRGVFLVPSDHDVFEVASGKSIGSWEQLIHRMHSLTRTKVVPEDQWIMEELVLPVPGKLDSGRDFKFYCFYGRVELVLEIQRYPKVLHTWWTRDGAPCQTGKYAQDVMMGTGIVAGDVELAEQVSSAIPAPFIRIDFLRSPTGLVFGEFTPRPGGYEKFDDATDERLGRAHCLAEGRLVADLLQGKRFDDFLLATQPPSE